MQAEIRAEMEKGEAEAKKSTGEISYWQRMAANTFTPPKRRRSHSWW